MVPQRHLERSYDRYALDELRIAHRVVYEVEANWKIVIDNFNECLTARACTPSS